MKRFFWTLIILFTNYISYSQFVVSIKSDSAFSDTLKICKGIPINYFAFGVYNGDTLQGLNFDWDFDDGSIENGIDMDTINHEFTTPGMYRIRVTVSNDTLEDYCILPVLLGLRPNYSDTKALIPEGQSGICNKETVYLQGKAAPIKWEEKRFSVRTELFPQFIDDTHPYSSYMSKKQFAHDSIINSVDDLDSVGVFIEHSNSANIKIFVTCPNGQILILKDTGGVQNSMGEPNIIIGDFNPGTGYWYYFSENHQFGLMNNYIANDTFPSGVYQPEESFSKLIGCPLNGNWTITVADSANDENDGYLWSWALYFDKKTEPDTVKYQNTYLLSSSTWSGDGINYTSDGVGEAIPEGYGQHRFDFLIQDNFSCWHDTSIFVTVEKPEIELEKESMYIGDSTHFADATTWSAEWIWNFGDDSDLFHEKEGYKKYADTGNYKIILKVTSETGCFDFDTANIAITPKPIDIKKYNIFTPNGDGTNDVFTFFNTPDELIIAANIDEISGSIFDRNGILVCHWNTPEEIIAGWDGTFNNNGLRNLPSGFYYYVIKIKGKDGIKYKPFSGTIYLFREKE